MRLRQSFTMMEGFRSPVRTEVCTFVGEVTSMPGCPAIGISHALYKLPEGVPGYGLRAFKKRAQQMRELGYAVMLCTVASNNTPQRKILDRAGARALYDFDNPQTGNKVLLYVYNLLPPKKENVA